MSNAPGGKSNFSLGWGSDEPEKKASKKQFGNSNQESYNIFTGESNNDKTSVKVNQKPGGNSSIVLGSEKSQFEEKKYGDQAPLKNYGYQQPQPQERNMKPQEEKPQVHTSVKVHNPPGGRSQITFG